MRLRNRPAPPPGNRSSQDGRRGCRRPRRHSRGRGAPGAAPCRADRLLLPDARLGRSRRRTPCRRRSSAPGAAYDRFEGRVGASLVALPDRDERVPRHARGPRAARAADGSRAGRRADRREPAHAARGHVDRADAGRPRRAEADRRMSRRARDRAARVRRRAPASPAAAARGAHPLRSAALEGEPRSRSSSRRASRP